MKPCGTEHRGETETGHLECLRTKSCEGEAPGEGEGAAGPKGVKTKGYSTPITPDGRVSFSAMAAANVVGPCAADKPSRDRLAVVTCCGADTAA